VSAFRYNLASRPPKEQSVVSLKLYFRPFITGFPVGTMEFSETQRNSQSDVTNCVSSSGKYLCLMLCALHTTCYALRLTTPPISERSISNVDRHCVFRFQREWARRDLFPLKRHYSVPRSMTLF